MDIYKNAWNILRESIQQHIKDGYVGIPADIVLEQMNRIEKDLRKKATKN